MALEDSSGLLRPLWAVGLGEGGRRRLIKSRRPCAGLLLSSASSERCGPRGQRRFEQADVEQWLLSWEPAGEVKQASEYVAVFRSNISRESSS